MGKEINENKLMNEEMLKRLREKRGEYSLSSGRYAAVLSTAQGSCRPSEERQRTQGCDLGVLRCTFIRPHRLLMLSGPEFPNRPQTRRL